MPLNLRAVRLSNDSALLSWTRPLRPAGVVLGYRLYFMRGDNFTDVVTVRVGAASEGPASRIAQYEVRGLGESAHHSYNNGLSPHLFRSTKSSLTASLLPSFSDPKSTARGELSLSPLEGRTGIPPTLRRMAAGPARLWKRAIPSKRRLGLRTS